MAKKTGFQHQRLLDIKSMALNIKSVALRMSEDKQRHQAGQLAKVQNRKKEHISSEPAEGDRILNIRDLQTEAWYTEQLNEDLQEQVKLTSQAKEATSKSRRAVEASSREKRTLEKLKERRDEAARRQLSRDEQKALDEVASRQNSRVGGRP